MPTILSQDPNGRWTIKNIRHTSLPGLKIPATFIYRGPGAETMGDDRIVKIPNGIEYASKTVPTNWYTEPGVELNIQEMQNGVFPEEDDVERVYSSVTYGGYTYKVTKEIFEVKAYTGDTPDVCTQESAPCSCDDECSGECTPYSPCDTAPCSCDDECTRDVPPCSCDDECSSECIPYSPCDTAPCDTAPCDCTCDGNEACSECTCNTVDVDDSESATVDNSPISVYCEGDYTGYTRGVTATDSDTHWIATPVNPSTYTTVDWVGVSPSAGTGNASIEISVLEDNTGKTIRNCFVWVRVPDNPSGAHGEVSVTQYPTPRFSVPSQSQVVVQHEGSTGENIFVNTNYGVTATTDVDWITLDQEEVANGVNVKVVVNTTPSAERTGNVTISSTYDGNCASFESVTVSVKQLYNPPIDPEGDAIYIHESATSTDSSRRLELNCNAAAQDLHIWIENSGDARVVENDGNLEVTDTGGNPFHNGETIQPTGLGNRRELIVKIPKNTNTSTGRTFEVKFKIFWTEVDSLGRHTAILEVTQARNNIWYDNYSMTVLFDGMQPGDTAHTFTSASHAFSSNGANDKSEKPRVVVTAYKHDTSGTYAGELTTIEDYIDSPASMNGVNDKMSIEKPYWIEVVHDGNYEDMQYSPTAEHPYALSFSSNQGYDDTGSKLTGDVKITYRGVSPNLTTTIYVEQPYQQIAPPDLGLHFYEYTTQSWTGTTITLTPSGSNNEIRFEIDGPTGVEATLSFYSNQNSLGTLMNLPYNGLSEQDLYEGVDFPSSGTHSRIFTLSTKGGSFDMTITCVSKTDTNIKSILTAHINAVV